MKTIAVAAAICAAFVVSVLSGVWEFGAAVSIVALLWLGYRWEDL